ncbi:MAG: helix-turn-helix domain-containing protein [Methanothrix sp.]|nr:helix-turn-helix domain-containing protein [Methanothrix sp.]
MADISRIVDLYDLYKSYRRVARELKISRNTVKKYVLRVKEVQDGLADEILPKNRERNSKNQFNRNIYILLISYYML